MATESKQIDGVVDDPENGGLKSGPCLIAGFHALSCTSPSYYNPYRGANMTCCAMRSGRRMRGTATTLHRRGRIADGLDDVL